MWYTLYTTNCLKFKKIYYNYCTILNKMSATAGIGRMANNDMTRSEIPIDVDFHYGGSLTF